MEPENRVYVGGIPVRTEKEAIVDFFSKFGVVKFCKLKKNSKTGRSLGYAYLTFQDAEVARALVNRQIEFCGRICECKPIYKKSELRTELAREKKKRLLVYDIDPTVSNEELQSKFESLASISHAYVVKEQDTFLNKGYGFVVFHSEENLTAFIARNREIRLRNVLVQYSNELTLPPKKSSEAGSLGLSKKGDSNSTATKTNRLLSTLSDRRMGESRDQLSRSSMEREFEKVDESRNSSQSNHESPVQREHGKPSLHSHPERASHSLNAGESSACIKELHAPAKHDSPWKGRLAQPQLSPHDQLPGAKIARQSEAKVNRYTSIRSQPDDRRRRWAAILQASQQHMLDECSSNYKFRTPATDTLRWR